MRILVKVNQLLDDLYKRGRHDHYGGLPVPAIVPIVNTLRALLPFGTPYRANELAHPILFLEKLEVVGMFNWNANTLASKLPAHYRLSEHFDCEFTSETEKLLSYKQRNQHFNGAKLGQYEDSLKEIHLLLLRSMVRYPMCQVMKEVHNKQAASIKNTLFRLEHDKLNDFTRGVLLKPRANDSQQYADILSLDDDASKQVALRAFIQDKFCAPFGKRSKDYAQYLLCSGGQENYNYIITTIIRDLKLKLAGERFDVANIAHVEKTMQWFVQDEQLFCDLQMIVYSVMNEDHSVFAIQGDALQPIDPGPQRPEEPLAHATARLLVKPCFHCAGFPLETKLIEMEMASFDTALQVKDSALKSLIHEPQLYVRARMGRVKLYDID